MINTSPNLPQVVDNNEVNYALHRSALPQTCNTCRYYGLPVLLEGDNPVIVKRDIEHEDAALVIKVNPNRMGYCTVLEGVLIINVPSFCGCKRFERKPDDEQFDDDRIEE